MRPQSYVQCVITENTFIGTQLYLNLYLRFYLKCSLILRCLDSQKPNTSHGSSEPSAVSATTIASNSSATEFTITPLKDVLSIFSTFCQNRNLNCITVEKLLVLQCYVYTSTKSSLKTIHLIVQLTFR